MRRELHSNEAIRDKIASAILAEAIASFARSAKHCLAYALKERAVIMIIFA